MEYNGSCRGFHCIAFSPYNAFLRASYRRIFSHQRFYKNEAPESPGPPFKSKKNLPPSGTIPELLHFTLGIRYVWLLLLKVHDLKGFLTELPRPSRAEEYF